jgi:hypothetical protein
MHYRIGRQVIPGRPSAEAVRLEVVSVIVSFQIYAGWILFSQSPETAEVGLLPTR